MRTIIKDQEAKLIDTIKDIRNNATDHYILFFHLSLLEEPHRSDFQLKIAANIINDIFRHKDGVIFTFSNGNIIVLYNGQDRDLLEKAIFQLRYLFIEDPLATHADGSKNDDFCTMYDLGFQWRAFYRVAMEMMEFSAQNTLQTRLKHRGINEECNLTAAQLAEIEDVLQNIDFGLAVRQQPICAVRRKIGEIKPVYNEIYVNSGHLARMLGVPYNLTSNYWLFRHLTLLLDVYIMDIISSRPNIYLREPISINLNINTILSPKFLEFNRMIKNADKASLVIEIDVADIFTDMSAFLAAQEIAHELGYRICLDGVDTMSIIHLDRASLGFDLVKIKWNADFVDHLNSAENKRLANAIKKCGSNRLVLCRCETQQAIDYGKELGISLFQGRYLDKELNPDANIEN